MDGQPDDGWMQLLVFIPHITETETKRVNNVSTKESNLAANSQSSLRRALKTPPAAEEQLWPHQNISPEARAHGCPGRRMTSEES